jgi:hypothetical protein
METTRKISIGIVMIVPGFVFGGLAWQWFGSWLVVFILEIIMAAVYYSIITGRFLTAAKGT